MANNQFMTAGAPFHSLMSIASRCLKALEPLIIPATLLSAVIRLEESVMLTTQTRRSSLLDRPLPTPP